MTDKEYYIEQITSPAGLIVPQDHLNLTMVCRPVSGKNDVDFRPFSLSVL